ncbi:MAG: threonylcarbamoyl-AMP synthase [Desulfarculus sp.]|nr:threonylcarbamoyl-AMP synthase [Desulfarculus sp.]
MVININPQNPQPRLIAKVVEVLADGGVVAYPTDTVYGLGCDIFNKHAIKRVHQIKNQPETKPFSFICPDLKELSHYARVTNYAYKTLRRLLPGPYTFVLEGSREVPKMMLTRRKTAGIRVPDHAIPLAIALQLGRPLLSTSATDRDGNPLESAWEIEQALGKQLDLIVDGGPVPGQPSSVVSLVDDAPEVLREGAGPVDEFRS